MATPATVNPFNFYPGRDGLPLQNGYLYFGEPFQDPELQPLQAYWDDANTQPAARPIRTINGYPARNGAPAQVFVGAQYSMRVRDSQGREVFYAPNVTAVDLGGGGLDIITASGGQTVVTLTNAVYTPGSNAIDIALNGIIQISGQDYFETGTNRITMASALSAGDQIRAFARSTFGLTQAVLSDWQAEVFDGDGTASQNFVLTRNPGAVANLDISVAGSTLRPLLDYTLSGNTVTITPAPAVGADNVLIRYGRSLPQDALRGELADPTDTANGFNMVAVTKTALESAASVTVVEPQYQPGDIRRYGALPGSAAYESVNNTAIQAAIDSGHVATIPEGSWYYSTGLLIGANEKLVGAGKGKSTLVYSGSGNAITLGKASSTIELTYNVEAGGFLLQCTNRASTVNGIVLRNAVYFRLYDITAIGSGDPNSANPANNTLYGSGLEVTDNSILGTIENVNCRIWNYGKYFWTRSTSTSNWSAAIEVVGGENGNNMYGLVIGDPAVAFSSAVGVTFRNEWFQGSYTTGVKNYSGYNTVFDTCYWEGNANYDYDQGGGAALPVSCVVTSGTMSTEGIGTTNYGTFPYLAKARVTKGFNTIIENNDMAVSTSIPLITVAVAAEDTKIRDNRLNSAIAVASRISNASTTTYTSGNSPEAPTVAIGTITRALSGANATVSYTGLGFMPTSIEFIAAVSGTEENSTGWAGLTNGGIVSRCIHRDAAAVQLFSNDAIRIIRASAGNEQKAVVASFDLDGFTLTWTLVGSPPANDMTVQYIARR